MPSRLSWRPGGTPSSSAAGAPKPPAVRTALLPGREDSEFAMPLGEFVAEAVALIEAQPDAREIQVERVKFLRYGEARGDYDEVVAVLNQSDLHGN